MFPIADTIVAISTAAGNAARAIVRLSGPQAIGLASAVFQGDAVALPELSGFRTAAGLVQLGSEGIELPARAYVFRAPRSYTRQDVVEFHIPGPAAAATALAAALIDAGARHAEAGEFTARAFFSGRIDLSAAEAVADVIDAAGDAQLRSAIAALGGRVFRLCAEAASEATDLLAAVEAAIDLAEEQITLDDPAQLARRCRDLGDRLHRSAGRAAQVPDTARRPHVAIAGRPNVGKSSLLNALTATDRAIVSALAGTTRDVLSAATTLGQAGSAILQDAAGFTATRDPLEAAAHAAARNAVARADAVLFVFDLTAADFNDDLALLEEVRIANPRAPLLILGNKADLLDAAGAAERLGKVQAHAAGHRTFQTSCLTGRGLEALRGALSESLHLAAGRGGEALGLHDRQKRLLLAAAADLDRAADLLADAAEVADVSELAAVELRTALGELAMISGQTPQGALHAVTEDMLGRIFARFCVGK